MATDKQIFILNEMDEVVRKAMNSHVSSYPRTIVKSSILEYLPSRIREYNVGEPRHWTTSNLLPSLDMNIAEEEKWLKDLQNRAKGISNEVRISLALNIITEEGLPHFHKLLDRSIGRNSALAEWNNLWTAEEDTHGTSLERYALYSNIFNHPSLEKQIFEYLKKGFNPEWSGDPWKLFVYTSLQEMATKISHENTGKLVENVEPLFNELTSIVARDEARHYAFYVGMFKEVLKRDPNDALAAAESLLRKIDMPAVAISNFNNYAEVIGKIQVYTMNNYTEIVKRLISQWNISKIDGLDDIGKKSQQNILELPQRLEIAAKRFEYARKQKSFRFPVIYDQSIELK
ncbi:MAG TPA: acyl-ACP desaturase [Alphaproteobacteria bacterium]|nr:acyl-ACP desaturase [Alphaproteobacteria bacterium]